MRYQGQGHEIEIELPEHTLTEKDVDELRRRFEAEYRRQYSRPVPGMRIEILNWGISVSTKPHRRTAKNKQPVNAEPNEETTREITCDQTGNKVTARIYQRAQLQVGRTIDGPALIVEPQTTTLVSVDFRAEIDSRLNILMTRH